ncbi:MAG TPA: hypothetical protein VE338_18325 [Ktedonobacterales bacterium]|nr:hypothetical protein [Ktedonobacterales bacterium]
MERRNENKDSGGAGRGASGGKTWQVLASRATGHFGRACAVTSVLYTGVTRDEAEAMATMLNRQQSGVTYTAREKPDAGDGL